MARLQGLKAITAYENKSEKTIRKLIREESYPAALISGEYESDTELIERWRRLKIAEQCMTPEKEWLCYECIPGIGLIRNIKRILRHHGI